MTPETITVRYGGKAPKIMVAAGVVMVAWTPVMCFIHHTSIVWFAPMSLFGSALLLGGFLMMLRDRVYLTINEQELFIHAAVGPIKRRFAFESRKDLVVEGESIWIVSTTGRKKVPAYRSQANPADWTELLQTIAAQTFD
jgi:hypothetical protein